MPKRSIMIESVPKLDKEKRENQAKQALDLLLNPDYQALFNKIHAEYYYWDKIKYLAPDGIDPKALWYAVKMQRELNIQTIKFGKYRFRFWITPYMQALLHEFDMSFGGTLSTNSIIPERDKNIFLTSSIMEEAIASSQMEGASTTRKVAKEMLRKQSKPKNKSQQMIVNNYATIRYLVEHKNVPFSIEELKTIHHSISSKTLDNSEDEGQIRTDDKVLVMDNITGEIAHTPPSYSELGELLTDMCHFANEDQSSTFIHPIVKGIIIHFLLAFIHPFADGNGRTARSLVYWYMLQKGYWLTEYLSISRIIYKNKKQYEKVFLYTESDDLDLSYFILFNLKSMKKAYEELQVYLNLKISQQSSVHRFKNLHGINERQAQVLRIISDNPSVILTAKELSTRLGVTVRTARTDLQQLVAHGFMVETALNKRMIGYVRSDNFESLVK